MMNRLNKNEYGFTVVEGLLILAIIAVIGFAGWWVYKTRNDTNKTLTNTAQGAGEAQKTQAKTTPTTPKKVDPTADWITYSSAEGRYSLKYPKNWITAAHPELCNKGIFLVAPNSASLGVCGSESIGEISFVGLAGDSSHLCYNFESEVFTNITKTTVTVSGITLTKQSGTTIDDSGGNGTLPKGTLEVNYCYSGGSWGFAAVYDRKPTNPDALNDFNTIVTNTLQFTK